MRGEPVADELEVCSTCSIAAMERKLAHKTREAE